MMFSLKEVQNEKQKTNKQKQLKSSDLEYYFLSRSCENILFIPLQDKQKEVKYLALKTFSE